MITVTFDPALFQVVPKEPTDEMWGEMARHIIMAWRFNNWTPKKMIEFLANCGHDAPEWLRNEPEMGNSDHTISKGTCAVLLYKTMLAAAPTLPSVQEGEWPKCKACAGSLWKCMACHPEVPSAQPKLSANGYPVSTQGILPDGTVVAGSGVTFTVSSVQALPDIVPWEQRFEKAMGFPHSHLWQAENFKDDELSEYRALFAQMKGQK